MPPQSVPGPSSLTTSQGHINFFEDLERVSDTRRRTRYIILMALIQQSLPITIRTTQKGKAPEETDRGIPLAPSEKDRKPWYSNSGHKNNPEVDEDRKYVLVLDTFNHCTSLKPPLCNIRLRDLARKSAHDPLTSINTQLGARSSINEDLHVSRRSQASFRDRRQDTSSQGSRPPEVAERLTRESSERQRALALIARKKRELAGSETPSTVHGGMDGGYGDVFNRREVEEAHRHRERRWERSDRRR